MIKIKAKNLYGERLIQLEKGIKKILKKYKPDCVVIEDIFKGRNANTFKILSLFRGVAIKIIYEFIKQDPLSIMASRARSALGIKNHKEDAFAFIVAKYPTLGLTFNKENDIADAIVLGLAGYKELEKGK
jgi:Holliday junction resolvasome RuvABC endonuclease subunit